MGFPEMRSLKLVSAFSPPTWQGLKYMDKLTTLTLTTHASDSTQYFKENVPTLPPNLRKLSLTSFGLAAMPARPFPRLEKLEVLKINRMALDYDFFNAITPNLKSLLLVGKCECKHFSPPPTLPPNVEVLSISILPFNLAQVPPSVHTLILEKTYTYVELRNLPKSIKNLVSNAANQTDIGLLQFAMSRLDDMCSIHSDSVTVSYGHIKFYTHTQAYKVIEGREEIDRFLLLHSPDEILQTAQKEREAAKPKTYYRKPPLTVDEVMAGIGKREKKKKKKKKEKKRETNGKEKGNEEKSKKKKQRILKERATQRNHRVLWMRSWQALVSEKKREKKREKKGKKRKHGKKREKKKRKHTKPVFSRRSF
eukprot:Phypoly_transcript_06073.p1 GENE.Phypoly_transcript_06073~~Phypoly_transcript_06073.p1  ORF type:complete len:366 (+),score=73.46 Phypoly_transcript_06073:225-1322(+)